MISVADATPVRSAVKETAGAITVAIVVTALNLFVIAEMVVVIAPMYAPVAKRNVVTAPVIYALTVAIVKPALVVADGAMNAMFAVNALKLSATVETDAPNVQ